MDVGDNMRLLMPTDLVESQQSPFKICMHLFSMLMVLFLTQDVLNVVILEITAMIATSCQNLKPIGIPIMISVHKLESKPESELTSHHKYETKCI